MEAWQTYLVERRRFLMDQITYVVTQGSRLEETTANGQRSDVTGDWLDKLQTEYAQISQILIDAKLLTKAQALADALSRGNVT